MSDLVPAAEIERIVGIRRHQSKHFARAVSAEQMVYVLHSRACLDSGIDLRCCRYSRALDLGIKADMWAHHQDQAVEIRIQSARLVPVDARDDQPTLDFGSAS